jgi:hypothetical protein
MAGEDGMNAVLRGRHCFSEELLRSGDFVEERGHTYTDLKLVFSGVDLFRWVKLQ